MLPYLGIGTGLAAIIMPLRQLDMRGNMAKLWRQTCKH